MGNNNQKKLKRKEMLKNKRIEEQLKDENTIEQINKILLCGTGDSGKSTMIKQMRILYCDGFPSEQVQLYKNAIQKSLRINMKMLIQNGKSLGIHINDKVNKQLSEEYLANFPTYKRNGVYCNKEVYTLKQLWHDQSIQTVWNNRSEIQVPENLDYYFNNLEKYCSPNFKPTNEDIVLFRIPTTGIVKINFHSQDTKWEIIDVGGQRSERRKWIHHFQDVNLVFFIIAINEFNKKLDEDQTINRMNESITLCKNILNNKYFKKTDCSLVFTKTDLLKRSLQKTEFKRYYSKYDGENNYEQVSEYIQKLFIKTIKKKNKRQVSSHLICATENNEVEKIINITIRKYLERKPISII
ncbi:guanine nucleotide-binding protein g(o) subunit alpha [Anaeramoeba flamelloides]|uniref:Guanine nucleotide-binding protein g(O) subunit alpha n=1 Tax=Anaeramoeba flamelloides TaxID=1746091 RepID=A0AAV7Z8S0_9EUKA|nr:guanine nucleotide-binding protein g(o) subunit alpha [Anaeramoeba flamelloides]